MYVTCHCHNNGNTATTGEEAPMSIKSTAVTAKPSVYEIVTDRIIASLKAGVIPWEK